MRVLVVPKWYPTPDHPAFGAFCRDHAQALRRAGAEVVVLASYATIRPPFRLFSLRYAVEDGLPTYRLLYRRPAFRPLGLLCQLAGMVAAVRQLRSSGFRPQIVHAHVYSAALPALVIAALARAPLVVSEHYTGFARGLVRGAERLVAAAAFRGAALVAPVSAELAGRLRPLAPRTPIEVVPNPVDCSLFAPQPEGGSRAGGRLLCVAAFAEKKGHHHLFAALALLPAAVRAQLTLVLAGDGELRGELERLAQRCELGGGVEFLGEIDRPAVAAQMRQAGLLVLPSLFENLPCVLLEALASGLPFVATAVGGVPELFKLRPVSSWCRLVPAGQPQPLAEAILAALRDGPPTAQAERELAGCARATYSYEAVANRWQELYRTIA